MKMLHRSVHMGLLTDILKEIPQAAVLKEKIATVEAKYASTETENAILKDDLHQAKAKILQLEKQIEELTHKDLSETEIEILKYASLHQPLESGFALAGVEPQRINYYLGRLTSNRYLEFKGFAGEGFYLLQQKGREALMSRGLI
jgi:predicted RNase H-like nuclease (RuvC/YqgF family)